MKAIQLLLVLDTFSGLRSSQIDEAAPAAASEWTDRLAVGSAYVILEFPSGLFEVKENKIQVTVFVFVYIWF